MLYGTTLVVSDDATCSRARHALGGKEEKKVARRLKKGVFEKIKETVFLAKIFSMKDEYLGQSGFTRSDL